MIHFIFIVMHIIAVLFGFFLLFISIPLHIIVTLMMSSKSQASQSDFDDAVSKEADKRQQYDADVEAEVQKRMEEKKDQTPKDK